MKLPLTLTRRWVALPTAVAAGFILITTVPSTIAAFVSGAGEPVIRRIQKQDDVTVDDLQTVIDAQDRGLFWVHDAEMEAKLGLANLLLAERTGTRDPGGAAYLEHARQALRSSLGRSPANPYPWTLLAYTEFLRAGAWNGPALSALRMAILTGPHEPTILWSRLRLALLAWSALGSDDRDLVLEQIRYAWEQDPKQLVKIAVDLNAVNVVRATLVADPEASEKFEEMLVQQLSPS